MSRLFLVLVIILALELAMARTRRFPVENLAHSLECQGNELRVTVDIDFFDTDEIPQTLIQVYSRRNGQLLHSFAAFKQVQESSEHTDLRFDWKQGSLLARLTGTGSPGTGGTIPPFGSGGTFGGLGTFGRGRGVSISIGRGLLRLRGTRNVEARLTCQAVN